MKSKLEVYALAVCFAAVVSIVISSGIAGYSILEIVSPELTLRSYDYDRHQTNEAFWENIRRRSRANGVDKKPSDTELTKQRAMSFSKVLHAESRDGVQTLVRCLIFILVSGITLFVHWRLAARARE